MRAANDGAPLMPRYNLGTKPRFKVSHVEAALKKASGIPSAAAEILANAYGSCSAQTVRNYMKRHPKLREVVDEQQEVTIDLAETKLLNALAAGNEWAIMFYLEMKGRNRGYSRRQEIAGVPGQPLVVMPDARQWLVTQLDQMESRLRLEPSGAHGAAKPTGADEAAEETVH
jgi:hypothetical protein